MSTFITRTSHDLLGLTDDEVEILRAALALELRNRAGVGGGWTLKTEDVERLFKLLGGNEQNRIAAMGRKALQQNVESASYAPSMSTVP